MQVSTKQPDAMTKNKFVFLGLVMLKPLRNFSQVAVKDLIPRFDNVTNFIKKTR